MNIETLGLRNFYQASNYDICNNKHVIESLNLQHSLKNLKLSIGFSMGDHVLTQCQKKAIELILTKEHFHKLENVIILLTSSNKSIDWVFKMLKKNVQLLKYQFKQCTIGLNVRHFGWCHILEWNKEIDKRHLDKLQAVCHQNNAKQEIQDQIKEKYRKLKREYWFS